MKENLLRGTGFIGSRIQQRFNCELIPRNLEVPEGQYHTLFYCAAYGNMNTQTDVDEIWKVNCLDFLRLSAKVRCQRMVYFSTSGGNSDYLHSKRLIEQLIGRRKDVVIVRPYSITGVGEQSQHLIPTAIDAALHSGRIKLDPDPVHDFLDVDDFIDALDVIVKSKQSGMFEIGSGTQTSNKEVIDIISMVSKKMIRYDIVHNLRQYDRLDWVANVSRLCQLGWHPKKSLAESIKEQIDARAR